MARNFQILFSTLIVVLALMLNACTTTTIQPYTKSQADVPSQVYPATFEDAWQAVHVALIKYRLRVDNSEAGILETEPSSESPYYRPPFNLTSSVSGRKSRMELRLVRGVVQGKPSTRVAILKLIEKQSSIVDEPEFVPSDGWEEHALLYRIGRELTINKGLQRYQSRLEKKQKHKVEKAEPDEPNSDDKTPTQETPNLEEKQNP